MSTGESLSSLQLLLLATAGLATLFAAAWALARRLDNFSLVDVVWAYAFAPLAAFYALAGQGWAPRRLALAVLVGAGSVRLGTHLARRVRRLHPDEDGRYAVLRARWSGQLPGRMALFFQAQALSVAVLGLGFVPVAQHATPAWHPLELVGAGLWLLAWLGEAQADTQLERFKRAVPGRGDVCTTGWWRYSRHPNYFFQWCAWLALALIALPAPSGWVALLAPALMFYLLRCVTGVPPTEAQALRTRGAAYRRYQQTTPVFFPGRPRPPHPLSP